jgi:hypothetical protein
LDRSGGVCPSHLYTSDHYTFFLSCFDCCIPSYPFPHSGPITNPNYACFAHGFRGGPCSILASYTLFPALDLPGSDLIGSLTSVHVTFSSRARSTCTFLFSLHRPPLPFSLFSFPATSTFPSYCLLLYPTQHRFLPSQLPLPTSSPFPPFLL